MIYSNFSSLQVPLDYELESLPNYECSYLQCILPISAAPEEELPLQMIATNTADNINMYDDGAAQELASPLELQALITSSREASICHNSLANQFIIDALASLLVAKTSDIQKPSLSGLHIPSMPLFLASLMGPHYFLHFNGKGYSIVPTDHFGGKALLTQGVKGSLLAGWWDEECELSESRNCTILAKKPSIKEKKSTSEQDL